jgi:lipid-A-disaccharide synthase
MNYFLIAGEPSGDLHGANLMQGIQEADPEARFWFLGGSLMAAKGGELVRHYRDMAFMGFLEIVLNIRKILFNFSLAKKAIKKSRPDVLILIDYPGFNLRMAEFASKLGIPVFYFISPKVWAWKESRVKKIKRYVNKMFVILPFEVDYYKKKGIPVVYEGNPLIDSVKEKKDSLQDRPAFLRANQLGDKKIIALLPGSRKQEIDRILPVMLSVVPEFSGYQFVLAATSWFEKSFYEKYIHEYPVSLVFDQTLNLLAHAQAALVTSGTATLEAAIMKTPQVVCYKTSTITYAIAKRLVDVPFISLVNLIMEKEVVTELIQDEMRPSRLLDELDRILHDQEHGQKVQEQYQELNQLLGKTGVAKRVGKLMVDELG